MSVGFGFSAGDFIAAISLIGKVVQALDNSKGARHEYKELIDELYTLESALICVKCLQVEDEQQPHLAALGQAAGQCQRTIDYFWNNCVRKYQKSLQSNKSCRTLAGLKDGCVKAKWGVLKQDDPAKFKTNIASHTASINMLLLVIQMQVFLADLF